MSSTSDTSLRLPTTRTDTTFTVDLSGLSCAERDLARATALDHQNVPDVSIKGKVLTCKVTTTSGNKSWSRTLVNTALQAVLSQIRRQVAERRAGLQSATSTPSATSSTTAPMPKRRKQRPVRRHRGRARARFA